MADTGWEGICESKREKFCRIGVPGGWVYRLSEWGNTTWSTNLIFVPKPEEPIIKEVELPEGESGSYGTDLKA